MWIKSLEWDIIVKRSPGKDCPKHVFISSTANRTSAWTWSRKNRIRVTWLIAAPSGRIFSSASVSKIDFLTKSIPRQQHNACGKLCRKVFWLTDILQIPHTYIDHRNSDSLPQIVASRSLHRYNSVESSGFSYGAFKVSTWPDPFLEPGCSCAHGCLPHPLDRQLEWTNLSGKLVTVRKIPVALGPCPLFTFARFSSFIFVQYRPS